MKKIVIATHNRHKLIEIKELLKELPYEFISLNDFPNFPDIDETGDTFLENSLIKARTVHKLTGYPAIGDDTGLEVDYLDGAPGIFSGRYAGETATYKENLIKLLKELRDVPKKKRQAQFRTVITLVSDTGEQWVEGVVRGVILYAARGEQGFGYDPIFYIPELKKTLAELSMVEKNKISHRGLALEKIRIILGNDKLT